MKRTLNLKLIFKGLLKAFKKYIDINQVKDYNINRLYFRFFFNLRSDAIS